ncbi:MAG: hypothetical protein ACLFQ6_12280 [Candidatus Sumerlaeia bacterium]
MSFMIAALWNSQDYVHRMNTSCQPVFLRRVSVMVVWFSRNEKMRIPAEALGRGGGSFFCVLCAAGTIPFAKASFDVLLFAELGMVSPDIRGDLFISINAGAQDLRPD